MIVVNRCRPCACRGRDDREQPAPNTQAEDLQQDVVSIISFVVNHGGSK